MGSVLSVFGMILPR